MRAPGTVEGNFAIESALDELTYQLGVDPIELRWRNYAQVDPRSGRPWSSNALRECYRVAQRFGWGDRNPQIGSMREGNQLIGYGMAGVTFGQNSPACQARISISRDGIALVRGAATDIGTGTSTIAPQLAAGLLGLGLGQVPRSVTATCRPRPRPAVPSWPPRSAARSTPAPATCCRRSWTWSRAMSSRRNVAGCVRTSP